MNQPFNLKTTILAVRNSISPTPARRGFLFMALACFALSPIARAADGGLGNGNTAEGTNALFSLTTGTDNTAIGSFALSKNTNGGQNTATGSAALAFNTTGGGNTANGFEALLNNTTGGGNTATGWGTLNSNLTGGGNTATGVGALFSNETGSDNTAIGNAALQLYIFGSSNTAVGTGALLGFCAGDCPSPGGNNNTATGAGALSDDAFGNDNTATGYAALANSSTGDNNTAVGANAGINLFSGSNNIYIGARGAGAAESNTIRIGTIGLQKAAYMQGISGASVASGVTVIVGSNGHLGTIVSSKRFKDEIKPMDKASEAILALKPVTFRYKKELDPDGIPQFGLVAEEVEKVNADLVARDAQGKVYTVRYEAVNAMLLNEFLKEHRTVQELKSIVAKQEATAAHQQKQIETLTAGLQKVSAQVEVSSAAPQMVVNNQ